MAGLGVWAFLTAVLPVLGFIDPALQMQLGNPSDAAADTNNYTHYLIQRPVEAIDYNASLGQANWVSWDLTAGDANGAVSRSSNYYTDTSLPPGFYRVTDGDYSGSGWTRGHMCPSADRTDSRADNDMVFLLSNLIPQAGTLNSGVWEQLEDYCRSLAGTGNEVLVICGPSLFTGATFALGHIAVPGYNWKIAVIVPPGSGNAVDRIDYSTRVIAISVTNSDSVAGKWTNYLTSVSDLQTQTGFTFFTALPPNVAAVLRSVVDGQTPPAPAISSFSPASGSAGTSVTLTGTNLNFTTNVTFNGLSASFSILAGTNLTATVPAGAESGQIAVATLGGNASSIGSFIVGTNTAPDLAISATHLGTFTQGGAGTYTIIVTNIGTAPSADTVSVVDTLPAGLTATALSGAGWALDLPTLTCSRTDALAAGVAYPPITVTVNVAPDAPASVTNVAVVSGGGDTNTANNAATDATTINPPGLADLAVTVTHTATFTQGDTGDTYTIVVTNVGTAPSIGSVIVTDSLPAGLTATGISGSGWTLDLGALTCTRSDSLPAGAAYPAITISVDVATNAAASITNVATVSGGGETNATNNAASDPTAVKFASTGGALTTLAGWDTSTLSSYGPSLFPPTTNAADVTVSGLTRGSGVGISGTAAARGWGGNTWTDTSAATAIASNRFATFGLAANSGYKLSFASISRFDYRRSGTGPSNGLLEYQVGSGEFTSIAMLSYTSNVSSGASLEPIDLSRFPDLQNVGAGTNVTFRIVNWAATGSGGTWYFFDVAASPAPDFAVQGTVSPMAVPVLAPIEAWRLQWFGTTTNSGAAADTAIATSDGMPNLLKYALGLNALIATNDPVAGDISTSYLRLIAPKNPQATDVSFHVEATPGLMAPWTTNEITIDTDTATLLEAHRNTPITSSAGGFIRLRVTRP